MITTQSGVLKMGFVDLPAKSTLIRPQNTDLSVLVSPLPTMSESEMKELGKVDVLFAPNLFHHMGLKRALRVWPEAQLWGPTGFAQKRKDLSFTDWVDASNPRALDDRGCVPWPYSHHIEIYPVLGVKQYQECVLYVPSEKTLICTDLIFNLQEATGLRARVVFGAFGTYRKLAVSRLLKLMVTQKDLFRDSLSRIAELPAETLIMAHGQTVHGDVRAQLKAAFDL